MQPTAHTETQTPPATFHVTASDPAERMRKKYERIVAVSKRVRWDIETDVIRGRTFDTNKEFLPDGLSLVSEVPDFTADERLFLSQIQGRTYANVFGLVERFINAKVLELSQEHFLGDQVVLEGLVRFSDEELKHQEMFRRLDRMAADVMPAGYAFRPDPNEVALAVLSMSTWAVLCLTLHIELFTQQHYVESIGPMTNLSPLWKDVFLYHWKEESQHALMDEVELRRHDATLDEEARDAAVDDFIALVGAVDGILQAQAEADADYFAVASGRPVSATRRDEVAAHLLRAYRWQYILSGAAHPRFQKVLTELVTTDQMARIGAALETLS